MAWGDRHSGGDCSSVKDQLFCVRDIQATSGAFAALLEDGSVVAWGNPATGGNSVAVQAQLNDVRHLQASATAFGALLADGGVVAWGSPPSTVPGAHAVWTCDFRSFARPSQ